MHEIAQEKDGLFFSRSQKIWQELGLTDIWDQRERMALNIRPFEVGPYHHLVLPFEHHWVNCQDLWFDTERCVLNIMRWLGHTVNQDRLILWLRLMPTWQKIHNDSLHFYRQLPQIISCIVDGYRFPIPDLTLDQEAIIQHCLIYQHNLNFKTWQLEKFPNDTQQLHQLLEPNIHPIDNYAYR